MTTTTAISQGHAPWRIGRAIAQGALVGGTLDMTYACIIWFLVRGASPLTVMQGVATGWLGKESFNGGLAASALGLASHYFIAFVTAGIYCFASLRLPVLVRRWVTSGLIYGLGMCFMMTFVVLPLSAANSKLPQGWWILSSLFAHLILFGLPIAYFARRAWLQAGQPH